MKILVINCGSSSLKYQLIDMDDETPIYIYGTINLYCSALDMNRLVEKYREEVQEAESREEEEVEAGEEDYNPDAAE